MTLTQPRCMHGEQSAAFKCPECRKLIIRFDLTHFTRGGIGAFGVNGLQSTDHLFERTT